MNYWLVKSEPDAYSWDKFVSKGEDNWDGVRNYQARNNLKAMKLGDLVLFYHSNQGLEVVGVAQVAKEAFQDPSTDDERWVAVRLKAVEKLKNSVSLKLIKKDTVLSNLALVKHSRLSVMPVNPVEFDRIIFLSNEK